MERIDYQWDARYEVWIIQTSREFDQELLKII